MLTAQVFANREHRFQWVSSELPNVSDEATRLAALLRLTESLWANGRDERRPEEVQNPLRAAAFSEYPP